jgi:4-amino-4-deoxy-L-arabinose transferase-like glycosyltransferase
MNLKKKIKNLDKYTKLAIIIILIGILIRFSLASIYHVSGDACWQLSNSIFAAENNRLPLFEQFGRDEPFWAPPLFHVVAAVIYKIFLNLGKDIADFAVKMISPILGSLTLILSFLIAKKLFNKKIAFYSLLFLTFIPLHIDYSVFSYVDGTITFLAILSVYLAINNRILLSAIAAGLTILTKYNGAFILPVLLFIIYMNNKKDIKRLIKDALIISIVPMAIGSIWFIRNFIALGNPVWPFMNSLFNGYQIKTFAEANVGSLNPINLLDINGVVSIFLGIFGVPNGNINSFSFFNIPYLNILLTIWLAATIIFIIPFLIGIPSKKLKYKNLLMIWIGFYIILIILYVMNASWSVARFLLPAFPAVALIWAYGMQKIETLKIKKVFMVLISLIMMGFVLTSFVKIGFAAAAWNIYSDDFDWIKQNTNKEDVFLTSSQCIAYNIERQTVSPEIENLEKADYIFSNDDFSLDRRAELTPNIIKELNKDNIEIVYENEKTKTKVYKIN